MSRQANERAKVIFASLQNNYSSILHSRSSRRDGGWLHHRIIAPLFSFRFLCGRNMRWHESYGEDVAVDLNARCLRRQLRIFAAVRKRGFAKLKRFIQIECTRTGETRKMRGSRSRRENSSYSEYFSSPLWTQPFVSSVARESSFSVDEAPGVRIRENERGRKL